MTIKVFTVDHSAWNPEGIKNAMLLGEFSDETEALTEIWRDLVMNKQYRAYVLLRHHPWVKFWRKPVSVVWGKLHQGMPRIRQEPLDRAAAKYAAKLS